MQLFDPEFCQSTSHNECNQVVTNLVTLGSPHAGLPAELLFSYIMANPAGSTGLVALCAYQPAVCEMTVANMNFQFNGSHVNKLDTNYFFIGGDGRGESHWQQNLWQAVTGPVFSWPNDGLVGKYSAVGWFLDEPMFMPYYWNLQSPPKQYWTDEFHSTAYSIDDDGIQIRNDYYRPRISDPSQKSHAYECFMAYLNSATPPPDKCVDVNSAGLARTQQATSVSQITQVIQGNLVAGQTISPVIQIDTNGETIFALSWNTDTLGFRLMRPDGELIDAAYVTAHPTEVSFESGTGGGEISPYAIYSFTNTISGEWTFIIDASNLNAPDTNFATYGLVTSDRTLDTGINGYYYNAGETSVLTATLQNNGVGLSEATVLAQIYHSDDIAESIPLTDQGDGNYAANYVIPSAPGYMPIAIIATGIDNGTEFSRQRNMLAAITSPDTQFTSTYTDQGRDDANDGFYEYLDFTTEIDVNNPGIYIVSALLVAGNGRLIASTAVNVSLDAGQHAITLPFNGDHIRVAQENGPYTIENLQIVAMNSGILNHKLDNAYVTQAYDWHDFDATEPLNVTLSQISGNKTANYDSFGLVVLFIISLLAAVGWFILRRKVS